MLEAFVQGLSAVTSAEVLLVIFLAVLAGLVVGILPGLGGLTTLALLIPFVWKMPPQMGIGMLMALQATVFLGGSITAVLLNIPGESANVVTMLDGYPMTKKGKGAEALGIALTSTMLGGLLSVVFAFAMIPLIVKVVMLFKFPETFMLTLVGFSFLAIVGTGSVL